MKWGVPTLIMRCVYIQFLVSEVHNHMQAHHWQPAGQRLGRAGPGCHIASWPNVRIETKLLPGQSSSWFSAWAGGAAGGGGSGGRRPVPLSFITI